MPRHGKSSNLTSSSSSSSSSSGQSSNYEMVNDITVKFLIHSNQKGKGKKKVEKELGDDDFSDIPDDFDKDSDMEDDEDEEGSLQDFIVADSDMTDEESSGCSDEESSMKKKESSTRKRLTQEERIAKGGAVTEQERVLAQIHAQRDVEVARELAKVGVPHTILVGGGGNGSGASMMENLVNMALLNAAGITNISSDKVKSGSN